MSRSGYRVGFMLSKYMQLTIFPPTLGNEKSILILCLLKNQLNQKFQALWKNIGHILNREDDVL